MAAAKPRSRGKGGNPGLRVWRPAERSKGALARPCRGRAEWKKGRGFSLLSGARTHNHSRIMVPLWILRFVLRYLSKYNKVYFSCQKNDKVLQNT